MDILKGKLAAYERHLRTTSGGPEWELHVNSNQWLPQTVKDLQQSIKHAKELLKAKGSGKENLKPSEEEGQEREMVSTHHQIIQYVLSKDRPTAGADAMYVHTYYLPLPTVRRDVSQVSAGDDLSVQQ